MLLPEMKIFNTTPEVKPVVRIDSNNNAFVVSYDCGVGKRIADRYVKLHAFVNASAGTVKLSASESLLDFGYLSSLLNKKPTC